jgi:hypothetical protein
MELTSTHSERIRETHFVTTGSSLLTEKTDWTTSSITDGSGSSDIVDFYFKIAVVSVGFVGTLANGVTLFALIFGKSVRKEKISIFAVSHHHLIVFLNPMLKLLIFQ